MTAGLLTTRHRDSTYESNLWGEGEGSMGGKQSGG